ncbi:hypothetical protein T440DRAFT_479015 [Plenodomus tracheiphilus IPT5]|uniref:Zn(2)-C6 fungal-type domain-containing protein n=1 Tax=Plenodomus tracheiphilus IPT5 TaxID=1408161 RepID=A0A6A7B5D3_9PLEO|nr:hypothetical protein T440DRAFT_479015 [Plenodomus tracheiphilus IPT5]
MTPRRPSSAHNDTGPQRLPFAAAEALLWGPEMKKQHQWLLQQMRALSTQHEAYDARIQTTEAVAEAAEAATARIRHMERQIAAIEAVEKESEFEVWAVAELNQLKAFRDDNKNVRQKQIELDKEVASLMDDVDKVRQAPADLAKLIRRVDFLGAQQKEDTNRIRSLERELADMRGVDDSSETEDEDIVIPPGTAPQPIVGQVPTSLEAERLEILEDILGSSAIQLPPITSARQRLFKRPSIHNSKLPRLLEETQRQEEAMNPGPRTRAGPTAPATQLVNKGSPKKHNRLIDLADNPRKTRSQARSPESVIEQPGQDTKASEQATQLVTRRPANPKKRVVDTGQPSAINRDTSKQPTRLVATSPRKKQRVTAPTDPKQKADITSSKADADIQQQQKQLIVVLQTQSRDTQIKENNSDNMQHSAAESVKTSHRKAAVKIRTCVPCSQRHVACDKVQPACGQCLKRSRGHACVYQPSHETLTRSSKPTPASPQKKVASVGMFGESSGSDKRATAARRVPGTSVSPRKRAIQPNAIAGPSGTNKGIRTGQESSVTISCDLNHNHPFKKKGTA